MSKRFARQIAGMRFAPIVSISGNAKIIRAHYVVNLFPRRPSLPDSQFVCILMPFRGKGITRLTQGNCLIWARYIP